MYSVPQQANPLQQMQSATGVMNALETNKLLQNQQQLQGVAIDTNKLSLARDQLNAFRGMLAPLLNKPDLSTQDVTDLATQGISEKLFTPQQAAAELAKFPRNGSAQDKQRFVQDMYVRSLETGKQIDMVLGPVQGVGTGGGTTFVQQPGLPNRPSMQRGGVSNTAPVGTPFYNPASRQQEKTMEGQPGVFTPSPGTPAVNNAPPSATGKNQDRAASGDVFPGVKTAPAAPPLGETEGASAAGGQSGTLLANDRANAADFNRQIFPLTQAIPALEALGKKGTGPGAEEFNQVKSFLQTLGIPGFDQNKIKTFDEARKYLVDWINANSSGQTNDRLAAAFSSNANVGISNAAAVDVAKAALAIRKLKQAQVLAFEATGKPESEYSRWASTWNKSQDPRVYGFDQMKPEQRAAVIKSLPAAKRAQFMLDVQKAEDMGLISAPQSAAPQQPAAAPRNPNGA